MRLSHIELKALNTIIASYFQGKATLYLYGSRADDRKAGGDIDLLLLVELTPTKEALLDRRHHLLVDLKNSLGDQKIDLTIATYDEIQKSSFYKSILPTAVVLFERD